MPFKNKREKGSRQKVKRASGNGLVQFRKGLISLEGG
jgi:hypothetical protein